MPFHSSVIAHVHSTVAANLWHEMICNSPYAVIMFLLLSLIEPALHYSLSLTCHSDEGTKKEAIATAFFDHFESLVEQVEAEDVANKLYGIGVLDGREVEKALDGVEPRDEHARSLMQLVKRKLWKNPAWFVDVCKILRACGVKAISRVIGMYP